MKRNELGEVIKIVFQVKERFHRVSIISWGIIKDPIPCKFHLSLLASYVTKSHKNHESEVDRRTNISPIGGDDFDSF